jgi:hypothetical protein
MSKKFDPAPTDKHAADPRQAQKADKDTHDKLEKGLEGTFRRRIRRAAPSPQNQNRMRDLARDGRCRGSGGGRVVGAGH